MAGRNTNNAATPQTQKEFIDYRFNETQRTIGDVENRINTRLDKVELSVSSGLKDIKDRLDDTYATKDYVLARTKVIEDNLDLIKKIVYGAVGLILTAFVLVIISGVFKH